jgi:hypothetical protein
MPEILTTSTSGSDSYTGYFYVRNAGATSYTSVPLPTGISGTGKRCCVLEYQGDIFTWGGFSRPMRYTKYGQLVQSGISAPLTAPTLTANTSATGVTGEAIGYITFAHKHGGVVIHESNLSAPSDTVTLTDDGRNWAGLPTTSIDPRVTHIRGYVSMDGALPRLAWERDLGATSLTEALTTAKLANRTPAPSDSDGDFDSGARGLSPAGHIACKWHDRAWVIHPTLPQVNFSKIGEFESFDEDSYLPTRDGEMPVALAPLDDELVVFYARGFYVISGFTEDDFVMRKAYNSGGCLSHHGIANIDGVLLYPSQQGVYSYTTGSRPRNLMARSRRAEWSTHYAANRAAYENSVATDDGDGNYVLMMTLTSSPKTWCWVGNYRAMTEEGRLEPYWSVDIQAREQKFVTRLNTDGYGTKLAYYSCDDGKTRTEDDTDDDDDGDSYAKKLTIRTGHFILGDQSGSLMHARNWKQLEAYVVNPNDAVNISIWTGDDDAPSSASPTTRTIAAISDTDYVKQSSSLVPIHKSGIGLTIQYEVTSPTEFEYRGQGLYVDTGAPNNRPTRA